MKKSIKTEATNLRQKADELIIATKELEYQNKEKQKRADELIIPVEEAQLGTIIE